jgi:hypothetical protein
MRTLMHLAIVALVAAGCGTSPPADPNAEPPAATPTAQAFVQAAKEAPAPATADPAKSASRVLAYVEGDVVTHREVLQRAGPELAQFTDNPAEIQKIEERALMGLLRDRMLYRAAIDAGVRATRDEIEAERADYVRDLARNGGSLEGFLHDRDMSRREFDEMIKQSLVIQKYRRAAIGRNTDPDVRVRAVTDVYVSPDDVVKYYDRRPERYREPALARCRILPIKSDLDVADREAAVAAARAKAEAVLGRLRAGEDWVPVFRETTGAVDEPDPNDGLVVMQRGEKAEWIESFAFGSPKGALSDVIQKGTTFYVLRAEGSNEARTVPFEEAASSIRRTLFELKSGLAWLEVQLSVLDSSSVLPETRRAQLRDSLRVARLKMLAEAGY